MDYLFLNHDRLLSFNIHHLTNYKKNDYSKLLIQILVYSFYNLFYLLISKIGIRWHSNLNNYIMRIFTCWYMKILEQ